MLKQSESYRRSTRDNAQSDRDRWAEYERRKRFLTERAESAAEYEAGLRRICDELGI
jgi:hypothetical protein